MSGLEPGEFPGEGEVRREPEAEAPEEAERVLGHSEQGRATNAALRALARAARSFLIYDSHNEAIRGFLADYRACMERALSVSALHLEIRPFEMVLEGEVVYVERDRDRSLAFRLFRDGVRRLVITPEVVWEELLRLLEILSIRYTGVRQYEDDTVTLLWKAGFKGIEIVAVEGFVLAEDDEGPTDFGASAAGAETRRAGPRVEVPPDWDRPLPMHAEGNLERLIWRPLPESWLTAMREEVSSRAIASLSVTLCREMMALVRDPTDPTEFSDVSSLIDEVRNLLLADGQLEALLGLATEVAELRAVEPDAAGVELKKFGDLTAWKRLLHSFERHDGDLPEALLSLVALVPADHLGILVGLLGTEKSRGGRRVAGLLVERLLRSTGVELGPLLQRSDDVVATELLRSTLRVRPEVAPDLLMVVIERADGDLQVAVREVIAAIPDRTLAGLGPLGLLGSPDGATRLVVLQRLEKVGKAADFDKLVAHLGALAPKGKDEAAAIGRVLARIDPVRAMDVLGDWVRPRQLWDRVKGAAHTGLEAWAGVSGLGLLDGEYPVTAIRWLAERSSEELAAHCARVLQERRKAGIVGNTGVLAEGEVNHQTGVFSHPGRLSLNAQMVNFEPTGGRWKGAKELDIPLRRIRSATLRSDAQPTLSLDVDGEIVRFVGPGAGLVHAQLQRLLRGSHG